MKASEKAAKAKLEQYGVKNGIPQAPRPGRNLELDGAVYTYKEGPISRILGKKKR